MTHCILGFDYGNKRIGVAVGQTLTATASPLTTLLVHHQQPDWSRLKALIQEWQPQALVVGLPTYADGTDNPTTIAARHFGQQLTQRYGLPVYLIDERLSSVAAAERLSSSTTARKLSKKRPPELDAVAAQIILETWLTEQLMTP